MERSKLIPSLPSVLDKDPCLSEVAKLMLFHQASQTMCGQQQNEGGMYMVSPLPTLMTGRWLWVDIGAVSRDLATRYN